MSKRKTSDQHDQDVLYDFDELDENKDEINSELIFRSKKRKTTSIGQTKEINEVKKTKTVESSWNKMPSQLVAKISSFNHSCYNHANFARVSRYFRDVAKKPTSWPASLTMRVLDYNGEPELKRGIDYQDRERIGPKIILFKHDRPIFLSDQTANSIRKCFTDYRPADIILSSLISLKYAQNILDRFSKCFDLMKFGNLQSLWFSFILIELPSFVQQISAGQCAKYKKLLYELQSNVNATDKQNKFMYDITASTLSDLTVTSSQVFNLRPPFKPKQLPNLKILNMCYSRYDGIDGAGTGLFTTNKSTQLRQVIIEDCWLGTDTLLDASRNLDHVSIKLTGRGFSPSVETTNYIQMIGKCKTKKLTFSIGHQSTMEFNNVFAQSLGRNQFIQDLHLKVRRAHGNLSGLSRMMNLQSLHLIFGQNIIEVTSIAFPPSLTTLSCTVTIKRRQWLSNSPILMAIGNCLQLEKLSLDGVNLPSVESIDIANLTIFANLTHLREMEIDMHRIVQKVTIEEDEFVISPSLTTLSIIGHESLIYLSSAIASRCKLSNLTVKYVSILKLLGVLTLDPNPLVEPTDVATFPPLETLTLYYQPLTDMKEWTGLLGGHRDGMLRRFAECYPNLKTVHIIYSHSFGLNNELVEDEVGYILKFFPTSVKQLFITDDSITREMEWNHLESISASLLTDRWSNLTEFMWTIPCSDSIKIMLKSLHIPSNDRLLDWESAWKYIDDETANNDQLHSRIKIRIPSQEIGMQYMSFRKKLQKAIPSLSKITLSYQY